MTLIVFKTTNYRSLLIMQPHSSSAPEPGFTRSLRQDSHLMSWVVIIV